MATGLLGGPFLAPAHHNGANRERRSKAIKAADMKPVSQSLLASFVYMDFWWQKEAAASTAAAASRRLHLKEGDLCSLQRALNKIGPWAKLIGRPLALGMAGHGIPHVFHPEEELLLQKLANFQLQC
jgi:hypothetical protein